MKHKIIIIFLLLISFFLANIVLAQIDLFPDNSYLTPQQEKLMEQQEQVYNNKISETKSVRVIGSLIFIALVFCLYLFKKSPKGLFLKSIIFSYIVFIYFLFLGFLSSHLIILYSQLNCICVTEVCPLGCTTTRSIFPSLINLFKYLFTSFLLFSLYKIFNNKKVIIYKKILFQASLLLFLFESIRFVPLYSFDNISVTEFFTNNFKNLFFIFLLWFILPVITYIIIFKKNKLKS